MGTFLLILLGVVVVGVVVFAIRIRLLQRPYGAVVAATAEVDKPLKVDGSALNHDALEKLHNCQCRVLVFDPAAKKGKGKWVVVLLTKEGKRWTFSIVIPEECRGKTVRIDIANCCPVSDFAKWNKKDDGAMVKVAA